MARIYQEDFSNRRNLEWQLSLGLWGSAAALTYAVVGTDSAHTKIAGVIGEHECTSHVLCAAILIAHSIVLFLIQHSHASHRAMYWWFLDRAQGSKRERPWKLGDRSGYCDMARHDKERWAWFAYHLLFTAIVLWVARLVLASAS